MDETFLLQSGIALGLRGGIAFEVEAQTVDVDLHSGAHACLPPKTLQAHVHCAVLPMITVAIGSPQPVILGCSSQHCPSPATLFKQLTHEDIVATTEAPTHSIRPAHPGLQYGCTLAGMKGGSVQNPIHALAEFVDNLHAPNGSVNVKGFYRYAAGLRNTQRIL